MAILPYQLTEDELHDELENAWEALHAIKQRFVRATSLDEKDHYLQAIDWAEEEHKRLWKIFTNKEFRTENDS